VECLFPNVLKEKETSTGADAPFGNRRFASGSASFHVLVTTGGSGFEGAPAFGPCRQAPNDRRLQPLGGRRMRQAARSIRDSEVGGKLVVTPARMQAMGNPIPSPRVYRFGQFTLDTRTGELSSNGNKSPLREQPLQLLLALLEQPGELVTRDELVGRLWPTRTFVDVDRGLNKAVNHLRDVLGDSAEQPRFVETLPRKGYRFVAPVTHGVQDAESYAPVVETPRHGRVRPWLALGGAALACLGLAAVANVGGARTWLTNRFSSAQPSFASLAVIPLENLSRDPEQEYFADGMTDELITNLAKLGGVRVTSRTSVMRYKGTKKSVRDIGRELNVDAIVEGTVMRAGSRARITAQLIPTGQRSCAPAGAGAGCQSAGVWTLSQGPILFLSIHQPGMAAVDRPLSSGD
jgi:TolB-like protein/DNA-binding winged helix-turn-helix (wHTH) protein